MGAKRLGARRWWCIALRGVAAILLAALSLYAPAFTFLSLVLLFGIYALIDGAFVLTIAARGTGESQAAIIARAVVSLLAGGLVLAIPRLAAVTLLMIIAGWAIISGVLEIFMVVEHRKQLRREWLIVIEGALSIAFGVLLLISPIAGAIALGLWIGAYALVYGVLLIAAAARLRLRTREEPIPELAAV